MVKFIKHAGQSRNNILLCNKSHHDPSNQGELSSVRSESPNEQSVKEYFQGLVDECIQEVSTMEYFRGNSHVVSVEDYKVVEYLDDIGWDIYIRMEYLTSFMEYCAGRALSEDDVIRLVLICVKHWNTVNVRIYSQRYQT